MSHGWLSAPTKLIDEKKTCVMVLGPTGEVGVAGELLSDKLGRDLLVNHWGPFDG